MQSKKKIGLFITGTDTGVGKTIVAGAIVAYLKAQGLSVGVMKPAETGCREKGGELYPVDAAYLKKISGSTDPLDTICPYRFAEPLAPAVAAKRAGKKINIELIKKRFKAIAEKHDAVIVEGAGGLMVPLSGQYLFLDLAAELGLPLVIVGRAGLGTINHTLLTLNTARERGLEISGIILNEARPEAGAAIETNPQVLKELGGTKRVFSLPYAPGGKSRPKNAFLLGNILADAGFFWLDKEKRHRLSLPDY